MIAPYETEDGAEDRATPQLALAGVWPRCAAGEHGKCLLELRVSEPWATAGLEPPAPGAAPTRVDRCGCPCPHVGRAKTVAGDVLAQAVRP